jgi:hypothetical protein
MLSWIRSWWSRPTVEKEEEAKYEGPPTYTGPIVNIRVLPEQYKINDKWWGTTLALKEQSPNDKGENV